MDELESIRKRKLESLKKANERQTENQRQNNALNEQIAQIEFIVKQKLTPKALERYGNLKAAHKEKAMQALIVLAQAIEQGRINKIDDNILKQILIKLTPEKKEFRIKRV